MSKQVKVPEAATHRHLRTGMYYNINENGVVRVYGANNKWSISKVSADSEMLVPLEKETKKEESKVSEEDLKDVLSRMGLPEDLINELINKSKENTCDCAACKSETNAQEVINEVAREMVDILTFVKAEFSLSFDVDDIMERIGFVRESAMKQKETEVQSRIEEIVKNIFGNKAGVKISVRRLF